MKIVEIISSFYPIGGAQTLVMNLCEHFSLNNEVIAISLYNQEDNFIVQKLKSSGIKIIFLNKRKGADLKTAKQLKKIITEIKPDIIHAHLSTYLTLFLSGLTKKKNIFYTFHSEANHINSGSRMRADNMFIKYLVKTNRIHPIAISKLVKESLQTFYGFSGVPVVTNGVDLSVFSLGLSEKQRSIDFVVVGSFTDIKNQLFILKCFEQINNANKYNITFVGEGPLLNQCIEYVHNNHITNVNFVGLIDNTSEYLKKSKVLCMASKFEGNPMVINEAIACGTFVLSNDVGGIPDLIVDDSLGRLINASNATINIYSSEMADILSNYHQIYSDVLANHNKYLESISIKKTCALYIELFEKIH